MLIGNSKLSLPTIDYILSNISDYQIFKYYFPGYEPGTGSTNSPLRKDSIPSFSIFYSQNLNILIFYDFVTKEKGDCFTFVSKLYKLNKFQTLCKICADFGLSDVYIPKDLNLKIRKRVPKLSVDYSTIDKTISIQVKTKPYTNQELDWWKSYGISLSSLNRYNVFSLERIYINNYIINNSFMFGYLEFKDNQYYWKIYQPFNKDFKWINNANKTVLQGYRQLPDKGNKLIITKSLKDVLSIWENTGISCISPQAESVDFKDSVIDELRSRFNNIYLLYDNDYNKPINYGRLYGKQIANRYKFIQLEIDDIYQSKDFSDLFKLFGKEESKMYLNSIIYNAKAC